MLRIWGGTTELSEYLAMLGLIDEDQMRKTKPTPEQIHAEAQAARADADRIADRARKNTDGQWVRARSISEAKIIAASRKT